MGLVSLLQTQAEVALAAADGDPNVAIEILMSQQVCTGMLCLHYSINYSELCDFP
jgi:hypothetical protein